MKKFMCLKKVMDKSEYNKLREEELSWLKNQSGIEQYKDCKTLDEVELVYKELFPAFYDGSYRRWSGWHEGVHIFSK